MSRTRCSLGFAIAIVLFVSANAAAQKAGLPEGPGKDVTVRICGQCHAVDLVTGKGNTRDGWTQVVGVMISRGAQGTDEEFGTVVEYLAANFPPKEDVKKVNVNKAGVAELQSGLQLSAKEAGAIVDYRKQNGDYKNIEDLKKVPGLDGAKVDELKGKIAF